VRLDLARVHIFYGFRSGRYLPLDCCMVPLFILYLIYVAVFDGVIIACTLQVCCMAVRVFLNLKCLLHYLMLLLGSV
jgi:hypothetical protein